MWQIWLILAGIFLVIEIINLGFLVFWFAIGALIAMVVSLFVDNVIIQSIIFLITSVLLLFLTKPLVNKILPKDSFKKTNSYSVEGQVGKVIVAIEPVEGKGQVKINGETWSAKSIDNSYIAVDTEVTVEKIEGVKAIVKPLL